MHRQSSKTERAENNLRGPRTLFCPFHRARKRYTWTMNEIRNNGAETNGAGRLNKPLGGN